MNYYTFFKYSQSLLYIDHF